MLIYLGPGVLKAGLRHGSVFNEKPPAYLDAACDSVEKMIFPLNQASHVMQRLSDSNSAESIFCEKIRQFYFGGNRNVV